MPNFDRTGPRGAGPMSGRAMGRCTGRQGDFDSAPGRGRGPRRFRGRGRGFGRPVAADAISTDSTEALSPVRRRVALEADRDRLAALLAETETRLAELPDNRKPEAD